MIAHRRYRPPAPPAAHAPPHASRRRALATLAGAIASGLGSSLFAGSAWSGPRAPAEGTQASEPPHDAAAEGAIAAAEASLLALDPDQVSRADQENILAQFVAPRVMLVQGSLPWITMDSFGDFLAGMGYPADRLKDAATGEASYSGHMSGVRLAGLAAWYYEREGMMPMLVGHSLGGMRVMEALHALDGAYGDAVAVADPFAATAPARATIVDPFTGGIRPVVGLRVGYGAAIATGPLPRLLMGQWSMLGKLREIPDSVVEFTGVTLAFDPIAGNLGSGRPYRARHRAHVRNLVLPAGYQHTRLVEARGLARRDDTRAWIDGYRPGMELPAALEAVPNLLHAADIWNSVRKHWCIEAQALLRTARMR